MRKGDVHVFEAYIGMDTPQYHDDVKNELLEAMLPYTSSGFFLPDSSSSQNYEVSKSYNHKLELKVTIEIVNVEDQ